MKENPGDLLKKPLMRTYGLEEIKQWVMGMGSDADHQIKNAQQFMRHGKLFEALMLYKDLIDVPLGDAAKRRIRKHFEFCWMLLDGVLVGREGIEPSTF